MPLPERQQFRIKDLAKRWKMSEDDVCEEIRAGHFKYLIISRDGRAGTFTWHYRITDKVPPAFDHFLTMPSLSSQDSRREWHGAIHSMKEFPWPSEESTLYIPQAEVEAFEQKFGIIPDQMLPELNSTGIADKSESNTVPIPTGFPWIEAARKIGIDIAKKHPTLSLEQIAGKVHDEMTKAKADGKTGMTGRGDRVPQPETIRRRALKGIKRGARIP
jgi:hypothetical protein